MNSPRGGLRVATLICALVSLGHLGRLLAHVHVQIGTFSVPQWLSFVAMLIFGFLAVWFWRLSHKCTSRA